MKQTTEAMFMDWKDQEHASQAENRSPRLPFEKE